MSDNISIAGIEKAVSALGYRNSRSLKYRLIYAIKQFYDSDESLRTIRAIDPEDLVRRVWDDVIDNTQLNSRRKNLNSIKSSVNSDLMKLFRNGKNPEGIIIGPTNALSMCGDAKDAFLKSFTSALTSDKPITLDSIAEVTQLFGEFLNKIPDDHSLEFIGSILDALASKKSLPIEQAAKVLGLFDNIITNMPDQRIAHDTVRALLDKLADKEEDISKLDSIDEEAIEEIELSEDQLDEMEIIESEEPVKDSEIVEVAEVLDVMEEDADEVAEVDLTDDALEELEDEISVVEESKDIPVPADFEGQYTMDDDEFDLEDLPENEKKRILTERFDRNLGAMERHFNQFLLISKGTYTIGSKYPKPGDLPEQQIQLNDFYMGKFPVINALFEVFVERTGYTTTAEKKGFGVVYQGRFQKIKDERSGQYRFAWNATHSWKEVKGAYWYQPTGPRSTLHRKRNHPVVQVSYFDAMAFASWVGKRLPTEAEWEATARTDSGYRFPWGDDWRNELCNIETSEIADTTPVDHFSDAINKMGIADLLGNTLEWTSEKCDSETGSRNTFDFHIAKGGSWISEENVPLASRFRFPTDFTSNTLGFRCLAD